MSISCIVPESFNLWYIIGLPVFEELHEVNLVSGRIAEGAPLEKTQKIEKSEEDELVPPAPELPLSPSAGQSSSNNSGNSSTHSVERGPSSTRSGGSYGT